MPYIGMTQQSPYGDYLRRTQANRGFDWRMAAPVAGIAALPALGAAVAGGAPGSAAAAGGAGSAAARKFTLDNILKFAEIGVPAVTSLLGQRSQSRSLDKQSAIEQANYADETRYAREQDVLRRQENARLNEESERRWKVEQQNRLKELAAAEEERAFNRRLIEARESRRADARMRLDQFLGRGR